MSSETDNQPTEPECGCETGGIKASELIAELALMIAKHGDRPVYLYSEGCEYACQVDYHAAEKPSRKLIGIKRKLKPEMFLIN